MVVVERVEQHVGLICEVVGEGPVGPGRKRDELYCSVLHLTLVCTYSESWLYNVRRPVICKILKMSIWGVPPACLGSR